MGHGEILIDDRLGGKMHDIQGKEYVREQRCQGQNIKSWQEVMDKTGKEF